jgi:FimV-like protein
MIYLIIKSYIIVLLLIAASVFAALVGGLYLIFKPRTKQSLATTAPAVKAQPKNKRSSMNISAADINAIAGEDVMATQLDLARAYIETGKASLAKKILEYVAEKGDLSQQQEARDLLGYI